MINRAEKQNGFWLIPDEARPAPRTAAAPRTFSKNLLLSFDKNIKPFHADEIPNTVASCEKRMLINSELAYFRGEHSCAISIYSDIPKESKNRLSALYIGAVSAMCCGEFGIYYAAQKELLELWSRCKGRPSYQRMIEFVYASISNDITEYEVLPEWFCSGELFVLPMESRIFALCHYLRSLHFQQRYDDMLTVAGIALSHAGRHGGYTIADIYLMLFCALAHSRRLEDDAAKKYISTALRLAASDSFLQPIAEFYSVMPTLIEECAEKDFASCLIHVKELRSRSYANWKSMSGGENDDGLSRRERRVAAYAEQGLSVMQIAYRMKMARDAVESDLLQIRAKLMQKC